MAVGGTSQANCCWFCGGEQKVRLGGHFVITKEIKINAQGHIEFLEVKFVNLINLKKNYKMRFF